MAPKLKSQNAGLSITLTGTPAARAAAAKRAASSSLSQPPTAMAAPGMSVGSQPRRWIATAPRGGVVASACISSQGSGA